MRLYEFARQYGLSTAEVSAAAAVLGFNSAHAASTIDAVEAELLRQHFDLAATTNPAAEACDDESGGDGSRFDGSLVFPMKLYKYAARRQVALAEVCRACEQLGIEQPHRHRLIDGGELLRLDSYFAAHVEG